MAEQAPPGYEGATVGWRAGDGGLNVNVNPSRILLKNVIQAEGVVFYEDHWRKEPGSALFGTVHRSGVMPPVVLALYDWHPTEGVQRIVSYGDDGYLYTSTAGSPLNPAAAQTNLSSSGSKLALFVTAGAEDGTKKRKLFLFRDNALPIYLDGDTVTATAVAKPAADWAAGHPPITAVVNSNRLWASGVATNPHQLYASVQGDHTDFQTTTPGGADTDFITFSLFPGVGERIYAICNFQQRIIVGKYPRGIYAIDARSPSPVDWVWTEITRGIGIAPTPYAFCPIDNDILLLSADGLFYLLSAVMQTAGQIGVVPENLSLDLNIYQYLLQQVDRNHLGTVQSVYFPFRQSALFTFARPQDEGNHALIRFDTARVTTEDGIRVSYSYRDAMSALALRRDPSDQIEKPMFGNYTGTIVLMEQAARHTSAGGYPYVVQTPHTNCGEFENFLMQKFTQIAHRRKNWDFLEIEYIPLTQASVTMNVYLDGNFAYALMFSLLTGGDVLGGPGFVTHVFTLGATDQDSSALGTDTPQVVRRRLGGNSRRISFEFINNAPDEDAAITTLFLSFRPGDEAAPRSQ